MINYAYNGRDVSRFGKDRRLNLDLNVVRWKRQYQQETMTPHMTPALYLLICHSELGYINV